MDQAVAPATVSVPIASQAAKSFLGVDEVVGGRFRVMALADWGGMGAVYRARDEEDRCDVALKLLLDCGSEERFAREARLLADLKHPGIVRYVAHGHTARGAPFLAMEWLEGHDLRARLSRGPLALRDALALARGIAEALGGAHARGIVHRDVNPRNVFLVGGDVRRAKVLDFGIARPLRATLGMTLPGESLGTPGYIAPEQARGDEQLDARVDVFALGSVLYECLAGKPPFEADNLMALLGKVLLQEPPRLGVRGGFPPAVEDLVLRMMAKDPNERPVDGCEVAAQIDLLGQPMDPGPDEEEPVSAAPRSLTHDEQRLVCVVMAEASPDASVATVARDGATLVSAGVESARASPSLARFGARIERLADGSLVATLVGGGDATDDAARAARFALALRRLLPTPAIALATGRGVIKGRLPVGEVLDCASQLLSAPPEPPANGLAPGAGPIRLDEVTAGLLDLRFDVAATGSRLELRGMRETSDVARSVLGRPTSCFGRERDLRTLDATFDECVEERVARAVLLTAPPGLGKTRLRREFLRRARRRYDTMEVFIGRADPMSAGAPFALVAQSVTGAAGIAGGEPLAVRCQKLASRVASHVPEGDRARVTEFLGELVGAPFPDGESLQLRAARQDPVLRGDQMRRAYEDWLRAEAQAHPLCLVLEDMHWGDLPTVKVVDGLLRNLGDVPLMILTSARPEVHDLFPGAWARRGLVELRLAELSPRASEKLIREVLGEAPSDETVQRLVEAAGGNPFCLEELIRAEAEGKRDTPPGSVLAVISARLGRLDPDARRVLRAASVFGQVFWRRAVASLLGPHCGEELTRGLHGLVEQELILKRGRGRFPGEEEFAFRHALVCEAAYAMLVGEDRVLGHRLAAAWLEQAGERDALTLAEHFDRGRVPEHAVGWYERAAAQALGGNDLDAAIGRVERAIALGAEGAVLASLLQTAAEAHKWRGANPNAVRAARKAMEAAPRGSEAWCAAAGEVAAACGKTGDRAALVEVSEALGALSHLRSPAQVVATARAATQLALAGQVDAVEKLLLQLGTGGSAASDPAVAGWVLEARAVAASMAGDPGARVRLAEAAAESFDAAGDLRNACLQRVSVGYAYNEIGSYSSAEGALRAAIAVAERMGLDNALATARAQLGRALGRLGRHDEAASLLLAAIEHLHAQKNLRLAAVATRYLAQVHAMRGDRAAAERAVRSAVDSLAGVSTLQGDALALLSELQRERGDAHAALDTAKRAMATLDAARKTGLGESAIRLAYAESLFATGDRVGALAAILAAKESILARANTLLDPDLRRRFLEDVIEHQRTFECAAQWG